MHFHSGILAASIAVPPFASDLVLRLDDQSPFAANADGSGGTPANNSPCKFWGDLSPSAANAVNSGIVGLPPYYVANALGGRPGLQFQPPGVGGNYALTIPVPPAALDNAEGSNNYTVLCVGSWQPYAGASSQPPYQKMFSRQTRWGHGTVDFSSNLGGAQDFGRYASSKLEADRGILDGTGARVPFGFSGTVNGGDGNFVTFGSTWDNSTPACATDGGIERFYVNGLAKKAQNYNNVAGTGAPLVIGALTSQGYYCWQGLTLAIYVYNRTLSPAEVWHWDAYIRARYGVPHPLTSAPNCLVWDGNSIFGSMGVGYVVETVEPLLSLHPDLVANLGWGGKTTTQMIAAAAVDFDPLLTTLPSRPRKIAVYGEGTNEANLAAATVAANLETFGTSRKAAGWPWVVGWTPIPRGNATVMGDASTILRADFAAQVAYCDALADCNSDSVMGVPANTANTTYYGDTVHPTLAGIAGSLRTLRRQLVPG